MSTRPLKLHALRSIQTLSALSILALAPATFAQDATSTTTTATTSSTTSTAVTTTTAPTDASATAVATAPPIGVNINGRLVEADPAPILQRGSVLVPLRGVLENLGATVRYDATDQRIDVRQSEKLVVLRIGQDTANTTQGSVKLTTPPQNFGGRTFVPLRSLAELFGYRVEWQAAARTVAISSDSGPVAPTADHRAALNAAGPVGVTIDFYDATPGEVTRLLDAAKDAGAGMIKTRFDWHTLEPEKGATFNWMVFDRVVREARQRGLTVVGILGNSAKWASLFSNSNNPNEWRNGAPRDNELASWSNYVRRVVGRYKNDVHAWQVWERPSAENFRAGRVTYRKLVRAASDAARLSDSRAILFAGEPGGVDLEYISTLNANGVHNITEGLNVYPVSAYQPGSPAGAEDFIRPFTLLRTDANLRAAAQRDFWVGGVSWPVLDAEAGAPNGIAPTTDEATRERLQRLYTPDAQADFLLKSMALSLAAGAPKVFWNELRDEAEYEKVEPLNPEFGSGLLKRDFTPRLSYNAFKIFAQQTKNRPYAGALRNGPAIAVLAFDNGQSGSAIVWSTQPGQRLLLNMTGQDPNVADTVYLATRPDTQILDSSGRVIGGAEGAFELTARPVWITNIAYETREAIRGAGGAVPFTLAPRPLPEGTTSVSADFGAANGGERGLYWRKFNLFRSVAQNQVEIGGRVGLQTEISKNIFSPAAGRFFIFLDVDNEFIYSSNPTPISVSVTVQRPEVSNDTLFGTTAGFNIQYAVVGGSKYTNWQVVEPGEGWATYTFQIPDAVLTNRGGYDIIINTFGSKRNLVFGGVEVSRSEATP